MSGTPEYGNWVSKRSVYMPGVAGLVFLGVALWFPVFIIPAGLSFAVSLYFAYARYKFSAQGGYVQECIRELVLEHLDWGGEGRALDVGCGNGALAIRFAKKYPRAGVVGIDYWGGRWGYSKNTCESNAKMEGVDERVTFQKASASALPFADEYFDGGKQSGIS